MKDDRYRQCELIRHRDNCIEIKVAFIPIELAKMGKILKIHNGKSWDNGWLVTQTGTVADTAPDTNKMIRSHRKNTGDNLPKLRVK